jgi:hypothetical protein
MAGETQSGTTETTTTGTTTGETKPAAAAAGTTTTTTETKPVTPAPKLPSSVRAVVDPKESPEFKAFLSKQEQFLKDQRTLRDQQEAFGNERAELNRLKALISEAKANPMKLLEATGLTPDQFAEGLAKGGPTAELLVRGVADRVGGLEKKLTAREEQEKAAEEERRKAEANQEVQRFYGEVSVAIGKEGEKYPTIAALKQGGLVAQKMLDHYQQHGKEITTAEAAAEVEKDLSTRFPDMVKTIIAVKPIRDLVRKLLAEADGVKAKETPAEGAGGITVKRNAPTSLDNSMGATKTVETQAEKLSDDPNEAWNQIRERRRLAARAKA